MSEHVAEKLHATLGASTASRWMACPGSVHLSETIPHAPSSIHAQEGTAAHALAELCLRKTQDAGIYVGTTLEGVEVTDDMAEFVQVFVDYCRAIQDYDSKIFIEHQFNLAHLNPPGPMFGTADFVAYNPRTLELEVVDLKYGVGVVVDVNENKQLRYYALGAALGMKDAVEVVKMTIVQPRATHRDGAIRSETISYADLIGFTNELMDAARATTAPDAPLVPGSHCRWCRASGVCPAQRDRAQLVAQVEFGALPADVPPPPALVPTEILAEWVGKFHILDDWMTAVRATLQGKLERGEDVPGYKLVAKRANRSWVDEAHTSQWLEARGEAATDIYTIKLKSPAMIEKLVGKKALPVEQTQKVSSGVTMVPSSDAREAVAYTRGEEFGVLTAGSEE